MASDAITVITNDHRLMEALFEQLKKPGEQRAALLKELVARLSAHAWAEEERVYPALVREDPSEAGQVYHGVEEHHEAEELLHRLQEIDPSTPEFDTALEELVSAVQHHVEEEETEILPELQNAVSQDRLEQLGAAFEERRTEVLATHGITGGPGSSAQSGAKSQGAATSAGKSRSSSKGQSGKKDISSLSREELYQAAKEADIPGRSHMSKDELADAVRRRS